jgi:hypothetical protein
LKEKLQIHWNKKKARQIRAKSSEYNFLWNKGECSQRICPGRLNSQLCTLLWCFMVTGENVRRFHPKLWRKKNWLLCHDNAPPHISFPIKYCYQKQYDCYPSPTLLTWPGSLWLFCFQTFWLNRGV